MINHPEIDTIVDFLQKGKIILYPTDTVWGIGCDATNFKAVQQVFTIKERDEKKSFVILVDSINMLKSLISDIPPSIVSLLENNLQPTTIIYNNPNGIAENIISKENTIAIRIVNDLFCKNFIQKFGKPIVSTSANKSGEKTPTFYNEISDRIKNQMDYIVKYRRDDIQPRMPSTILKIDENNQIITIRA